MHVRGHRGLIGALSERLMPNKLAVLQADACVIFGCFVEVMTTKGHRGWLAEIYHGMMWGEGSEVNRKV